MHIVMKGALSSPTLLKKWHSPDHMSFLACKTCGSGFICSCPFGLQVKDEFYQGLPSPNASRRRNGNSMECDLDNDSEYVCSTSRVGRKTQIYGHHSLRFLAKSASSSGMSRALWDSSCKIFYPLSSTLCFWIETAAAMYSNMAVFLRRRKDNGGLYHVVCATSFKRIQGRGSGTSGTENCTYRLFVAVSARVQHSVSASAIA